MTAIATPFALDEVPAEIRELGDHVVAAKAAFGSCRWLVDTLLPKFGIATTTVDARDPQAFRDALRPNTKVFFFETPANPTMDVVDLKAVCGIARERGGGLTRSGGDRFVELVRRRDNAHASATAAGVVA